MPGELTFTQVEERMRLFLPGLLPSGWSRLTNRVVQRDDGVAVIAYSGFGLVVTVEAHPTDVWIKVERRKGELSISDIELVEFGLYRQARRTGRIRRRFGWEGRVAKFPLIE